MLLQLENISLSSPSERIIHPCSLSCSSERITTLLGATLSGKTTLMRLMAGLVAPSSGRVLINGENITKLPLQKRNVSMVYQQFINYPYFTVRENIASPLRIARVPEKEISRRVGEFAELLKLTPYLDRKPNELSGGQQQRTAIARALVKDANLVLLDEPLANLDYKLREDLRDELPRLMKGRQSVVVYATTEPSEALQLGGQVVTLHEGHLTQAGSAQSVFREPNCLQTARVFADPPLNSCLIRLDNTQVSLGKSIQWPAPELLRNRKSSDIYLGLRPHHIFIGSLHGLPIIQGRVKISEISGSETTVHFEFDKKTWICSASGVHRLEPHSVIPFSLNISQALYFDAQEKRIAPGTS